MFFNYPSCLLPAWLDEAIPEISRRIKDSDIELKYGLSDFFESIPINLVNAETIQRLMEENKKRLINQSDKPLPRYDGNGTECNYPDRWDFLYMMHDILLESFLHHPTCLLAKKGVSSSGKEVLILDTEFPLPDLFFRTVYPLCWNALDSKSRFPVSSHPVYPVFYRYMQEPLSIAMALAVTYQAFDNNKNVLDSIIDYIRCLPGNYSSGIILYQYGLHMRWKDWRDDCKRCLNKFDTIGKWVTVLARPLSIPTKELIVSLWADLFDLSAVELQALLSTTKYAPVICESDTVYGLACGLLRYVSKYPKGFISDSFRDSRNHLANLAWELASGRVSSEDAVSFLPQTITEETIQEFIRVHMSGWSFERDLGTGMYHIYGQAVLMIQKQKAEKDPNNSE